MKHVGLALLLVMLPISALVGAPSKGAAGKAAAPGASADDESVQVARDLAKPGTKLFAMKKYKDALDIFLKSHEVHPLPEVVWNIARCYEELGDVENAIVFFEESAATDEDPGNRAEARARADKLKAGGLGVLALETVPADGVQIEIDGQAVGASPLPPRPLRKGVHELRLAREGFAPLAKSVEIVAGMKNSFRFELEALKAVLALDAPKKVENVEVRLDGLVAGVFTLPTTLEYTPGAHRVTITGLTDYEDLDRPVTLTAGESTHVELQKRKTSPAAAAALAPGGVAAVTPAAGADVAPSASRGAGAAGNGAGAAADGAGAAAGAAGDPGDEAKTAEPETKKGGLFDFQRDTWYINLLFGYSWGGFKGVQPDGSSGSSKFSTMFEGFSGNVPLAMRLGFGATLTQNFLLGADFDVFVEAGKRDLADLGETGDLKATLLLMNVNAMLHWFPLGDLLFLKFGGGFSRVSLKIESDFFDNTSDSNGYGIAMGSGITLGFGKGFHLIFDLQYAKQWFNADGLDGTWTLALCGGVGWY